MMIQAVTDVAIRGTPQGAAPTAERQPAARPEAVRAETPEPRDPTPAEAQRALEGVNAFLASNNSHVQFALHEGAKRMMVEVVDNQTREVVRTIPAKELLDLAAKIGEMVGTLLDRRG